MNPFSLSNDQALLIILHELEAFICKISYYSAFINVNAPKLKKAMFAVHAAMLGGNISPYPSDKQKL